MRKVHPNNEIVDGVIKEREEAAKVAHADKVKRATNEVLDQLKALDKASAAKFKELEHLDEKRREDYDRLQKIRSGDEEALKPLKTHNMCHDPFINEFQRRHGVFGPRW